MARRVETFPDRPSQSRYPWDEWLDGSVWELVRGEDFKGKPATFRSMAIDQAKKRNGKVRTRLLRGTDRKAADRLYVQFEQDGHEGVAPGG
jgi:hypothetical protein